MRYRTTADVVIPKGTEVFPPPSHSTRWKRDFDTSVAHGRDHCSYWSIDPEEGLESGILEKIGE